MGRCCSVPETKKTLTETEALVAKVTRPSKDVVCFACRRPCRAQHLYQRSGLDTIGMCDACFHDFSHFEL